jgi:ABC-2 type transport system permease protein
MTAALKPFPGLRLYTLEIRTEFLRLWRTPSFAVPTIMFPLVFYTIFGLTYSQQSNEGLRMQQYMLATYGAFGVIGCSLFSFGVGISADRSSGWLRLKRISPMPPMAWLVARILMAMLFSLIIVLGLFLLGITIGRVSMPLETWIGLGGVLVFGSVPFVTLGFILGYLTGPSGASALANLIYLPMSFASGLWTPINMLPAFLQGLAPYLPPYHFAQLALEQLRPQGNTAQHALALGIFTAIFLTIAVIAYRRDEGRTSS